VRGRRGLSPLVATVLLISATVLGGVLVYQYFQTSVSHAKGLQQDLMVTADAVTLNANTTLVRVTVVNQGSNNIIINNIILLDNNGNKITATLLQPTSLNKTVSPGDKLVIILKTSERPSAVYVEYSEKGKSYTTEPVEIPQ
jgi:archaellum component FlaF (FlaF/FlaG flagellin family)